MDDDEIFDRSMAALGVEPLDDGVPGRRAAQRGRRRADGDRRLFEGSADRERRREDDDRRLFEEAMRDLATAGRRDRAGGREPAARPRVRRLKTAPKNLRVDDQVDLHGLRAEAAVERLTTFVAEASSAGSRRVLVITGKGRNSPGGRGVLRQRVEDWIRGRDGHRLRAWSDAPPRLGGRGALVLYLRPSTELL